MNVVLTNFIGETAADARLSSEATVCGKVRGNIIQGMGYKRLRFLSKKDNPFRCGVC